MSGKEMGDVFTKWNKGVLDSFLIEITRDIVSKHCKAVPPQLNTNIF